MYNNPNASTAKNGLQFGDVSSVTTNFSTYNSIIVSNDDLVQKSLNFIHTNTTDVINCILRGINSTSLSIIDDVAKNNQKGKTSIFTSLSGALSDERGYYNQVITIDETSAFVDYCLASFSSTYLQ